MSKKRYYGEFYTPFSFAKKGVEYIDKAIGLDNLKSGEYRIWDMASGIGNLEYYLPKECMKYTYMSTLYEEDVLYSKNIFKEATIFQYDYLNDDIVLSDNFIDYKKIPSALKRDLKNKKLKWLIFINPPYATSQVAGTNSKSKKNVSKSLIRDIMHKEGLGESSRELYAQFMFRIKYEFKDKDAFLALFSKINYMKANNSEKFRECVCRYRFLNGFMFSSSAFDMTSKLSPFPVCFINWHINENCNIKNENIILDILDSNTNIIHEKKIEVVERNRLLNKWIKRERGSIVFVPLSSAITVKNTGNDIRNRICEGFLASLMTCGNDLQKQNLTAILSAPQASAGALSITKDNFERAMIIHAVRRIVEISWINSSDQFVIPREKLSDYFTLDAIVWSIFSSSNQTVSMDNVLYNGKTYKIINNFFPFSAEEIKLWIEGKNIVLFPSKDDERFLYLYLKNKKLSKEARLLFTYGKSLYKYFYENIEKLNLKNYKISSWDTGFWQIRKSLKEIYPDLELFEKIEDAKIKLKEKLLKEADKFIL